MTIIDLSFKDLHAIMNFLNKFSSRSIDAVLQNYF